MKKIIKSLVAFMLAISMAVTCKSVVFAEEEEHLDITKISTYYAGGYSTLEEMFAKTWWPQRDPDFGIRFYEENLINAVIADINGYKATHGYTEFTRTYDNQEMANCLALQCNVPDYIGNINFSGNYQLINTTDIAFISEQGQGIESTINGLGHDLERLDGYMQSITQGSIQVAWYPNGNLVVFIV